jgi:hypothetical protein
MASESRGSRALDPDGHAPFSARYPIEQMHVKIHIEVVVVECCSKHIKMLKLVANSKVKATLIGHKNSRCLTLFGAWTR